MNLNTRYISPQYHVVYDDDFTTVLSAFDDTPPPNWEDLIQTSLDIYHDPDEEAPLLHDDWNPQEPDATEGVRPPFEVPDINDNGENLGTDDQQPDAEASASPRSDQPSAPTDTPTAPPLRRNSWRRVRGSNPHANNHVYETYLVTDLQYRPFTHDDLFMNGFDKNKVESMSFIEKQFAMLNRLCTDDDGMLHYLHPLAFATKALAADTPTYAEAMSGPDAEGYMEAMDVEIEALEKLGSWDAVDIIEAHGHNIIDSTWAFKKKRYPDGSMKKLKARFCVRGDQQVEGLDYFETYAPVVAWSTVRLMLVLSVFLGLCSKQVDYTNAFCQADLNEDVFLRMPRGYQQKGKVLKL